LYQLKCTSNTLRASCSANGMESVSGYFVRRVWVCWYSSKQTWTK